MGAEFDPILGELRTKDIQFPLLSTASTTNLVHNPSFEGDTPGNLGTIQGGWTYYGNNGTYKGVANDFAEYGVNSFKCTAVNDGGIYVTITGLSIGAIVTASVWIKTDATGAAGFILDTGQHGVGGSTTKTNNQGSNVNGRFSITMTLDAAGVNIFLGQGSFGAGNTGTAWFDGIMLQVNQTDNGYIDGNQPSIAPYIFSWNGAANSSTSVRNTFGYDFGGYNIDNSDLVKIAGDTMTGPLIINDSPIVDSPVLQVGQTLTTGTLVVQINASDRNHSLIGIYDAGNNAYYGISLTAGGKTIGGINASTLGGYFGGLAITGFLNQGTGQPLFGILAANQSGSGIGNTALTIYDTNQVTTFNNILDNGSGAAQFIGAITLNSGSIITDTTTGLKIGTATTQKLGFFNATPVVQQSQATDIPTVLSNLGLRAAGIPSSTPAILSTVTGINAKTVAQTNLYTVPTGKTAVITAAIVRSTAASSITNGPTASIGFTSTAYSDIYVGQNMITLTGTTSIFGYSSVGALVSAAAATVIKFNITTGSTGTSQTVAVDLIGYLI